MFDIIIGRNPADKVKHGKEGTIFIGKQYVRMGQVESLSNPVYMDVSRSHVVFVCGKRGGGKSYTLGVVCEGIAGLPRALRSNLSVIILDTMGIYWTMKHANRQDRGLLEEWGLKGKGLEVTVIVPEGSAKEMKEQGLPVDGTFAVNPMELSTEDWRVSLGIEPNTEAAVLLGRTVEDLQGKDYGITELVRRVELLKGSSLAKEDLKNRFEESRGWGLFSKKATPIEELAKPGKVTVLDLSCYNIEGGWTIKALAAGLIAEKLFNQRMEARKHEEFKTVEKEERFMENEGSTESPLVWLVLDEAHEFLPREGKTLASDPFITILREGRQPGISLVLASQQPGKIHTDVLTQADTVISHRITAKIDTDALGILMQSYMRAGLAEQLDHLPRTQGAALVFDDTNERMYPIQVRPRLTWHGGSSPNALSKQDPLK